MDYSIIEIDNIYKSKNKLKTHCVLCYPGHNNWELFAFSRRTAWRKGRMVRESWVTERWSATRYWTRSGGTPWRTCLCRTRTPRRSSLARHSGLGCSDCSTTAATATAMRACAKPTVTTWTCRRTRRASYDQYSATALLAFDTFNSWLQRLYER